MSYVQICIHTYTHIYVWNDVSFYEKYMTKTKKRAGQNRREIGSATATKQNTKKKSETVFGYVSLPFMTISHITIVN